MSEREQAAAGMVILLGFALVLAGVFLWAGPVPTLIVAGVLLFVTAVR